MKKVYQCEDCKQVTIYHKPGYPCGYCGSLVVKEHRALTDKPPKKDFIKQKGQSV